MIARDHERVGRFWFGVLKGESGKYGFGQYGEKIPGAYFSQGGIEGTEHLMRVVFGNISEVLPLADQPNCRDLVIRAAEEAAPNTYLVLRFTLAELSIFPFANAPTNAAKDIMESGTEPKMSCDY